MLANVFLDSGSQCTLIKQSFARSIAEACNLKVKRTKLRLSAVDNQVIEVLGAITLDFEIGGQIFKHDALVTSAEAYHGSVLAGTDLMQRLGKVSFDFDSHLVKLNGQDYDFRSVDSELGSLGLNKLVAKLAVENRTVSKIDGLSVSTHSVEVPFPENTQVLVEVGNKARSCGLINTIAPVTGGKVEVGVMNWAAEPRAIEGDNWQLTVSLISDQTANIENDFEEPELGAPDLSHLTEVEQVRIKEVLEFKKGAIAQTETDLGFCPLIEHAIDTGDNQPVATRQWPIPHSMLKVMESQCQEMLSQGVIEPCASAWRSPTLLVRKKDDSFRYVIDYRNINKITVKDKFPLPRIDTVLNSLNGARIFTTLDLKSGYYQVPIRPADRVKTAFSTGSKTYCYRMLAMGLCNAAATFQRLMQTVLEPVLGRCALVFLDDIIVYSESFEDHVTHLNEVLEALENHGLKVSPKKCSYAKTRLKYLGHVVSSQGIEVDEEKVRAIEQMPAPKTKRQVRGILGMASYYRKFIKDFSRVAAPLTELTKKDVRFAWRDEHQKAFEDLKHALCRAPILSYPDHDKTFRLHTDASDLAVGAVLTQKIDGIDRPIGYFSRKLNDAEKRYNTTEKEALAIVSGVKNFAQYLFGYKFTILTDHAPLRYIFQYKATIPRITRWALLLAEFDFEIIYKPGREHIIPDTLSRAVSVIETRAAVSSKFNPANVFEPSLVSQMQRKQRELGKLMANLEGEATNQIAADIVEKYVLQQGCLYYLDESRAEVKTRLVVPASMKREALYLSHDTPLGGHFGVRKTLERSREMFFWPNQADDVKRYVQQCQVCQKRNVVGLQRAKIGQLPMVTRPLERVGIDLIGKISPSLSGNQYVLTIVDHMTRFVQAYPLRNKNSETVAHAFLDFVCRYGCPEHIVSDRGSEFTAETFREVARLLQSKLHFTSAYHPQSNGMTEAFNKLIKNTISGMITGDVKTWDEQLPCAILALNCSYHPSVKNTPYFLLHGRDPPLPYSSLLGRNMLNYALNDDSPSSVFARLQKAFQNAQVASAEAHNKNVKYQKHSGLQFHVGDAVFLHNNRKNRGAHSKFLPAWLGPYRILERIGDANYVLQAIYGSRKKEFTVHQNRLKLARVSEDSAPFVSREDVEPSEGVAEKEGTAVLGDEDDESDDDGFVTFVKKRVKESKQPECRYALRSKRVAEKQVVPARRSKRLRVNTTTVLAVLMVLFTAILIIG